ncbi:transcriptional regulator, TetR family [Blastococcus aggregatus]|uniref:Transcriptional regulator, TetR family n=1 Tax=Blastococcus aggregatus TaxID=38502 RepID=A0A285VD69_9ACTN|nr:TetR/AcrR family transcriptional regulator [Blastococcus aggregatus]SOC52075.1 transcriptional regulator, TetR family [Blastococcus aggregatus]
MPRIRAATVAEHRAAQRRALLDAGRRIVAESGRPPTLSGVAAGAGLARSSVYEYFTSADDLLAALVEDITPRWAARVRAEVDAAGSPAEAVLAYVHAHLAQVAEGEHAIIAALATIAPGHVTSERARSMHDALSRPLLEALGSLGVPDADLVAGQIDALVRGASRQIEEGTADLDRAWAAARSVLEPFVRDRGRARG